MDCRLERVEGDWRLSSSRKWSDLKQSSRKRPSRSRGQVAFEFSMMIALGMFLMLLFLIIASTLIEHQSQKELRAELLEFGRAIQEEAIIASTVNYGYQRTVLLPEKIGRYAYTITTEQNAIVLEAEDSTFVFPTPPTEGSWVKGDNTITNMDGTVRINI